MVSPISWATSSAVESDPIDCPPTIDVFLLRSDVRIYRVLYPLMSAELICMI